MEDDERFFDNLDPAKLLPFTRFLEAGQPRDCRNSPERREQPRAGEARGEVEVERVEAKVEDAT